MSVYFEAHLALPGEIVFTADPQGRISAFEVLSDGDLHRIEAMVGVELTAKKEIDAELQRRQKLEAKKEGTNDDGV